MTTLTYDDLAKKIKDNNLILHDDRVFEDGKFTCNIDACPKHI